MMKAILRGDIFYANFDPVVGSEQGGIRPALIIQNDVGNKFSPTVVVAAITSKEEKRDLVTHCTLPDSGLLPRPSIALLEQIRTLDKSRLRDYIGTVGEGTMERVDRALAISVGLEYVEGN